MKSLSFSAFAVLIALCLALDAGDNAKYQFPSDAKPIALGKVVGIGALRVDESGVEVDAADIEGAELRDSSGAKKTNLFVKLGEEFQIVYRNKEESYFRLDKIEGDWAYFSSTRLFLAELPYAKKGSTKSYPCKIQAFERKAPASQEGKYDFPQGAKPVKLDRIAGIGGLKTLGSSIEVFESRNPEFELRDSAGTRVTQLTVKLGEEFQLLYPSEDAHYRLDKIEGDFAVFSCHRRFLMKTSYAEKGSEQSFPCKLKAFSND